MTPLSMEKASFRGDQMAKEQSKVLAPADIQEAGEYGSAKWWITTTENIEYCDGVTTTTVTARTSDRKNSEKRHSACKP